jgi:hypothetical protein
VAEPRIVQPPPAAQPPSSGWTIAAWAVFVLGTLDASVMVLTPRQHYESSIAAGLVMFLIWAPISLIAVACGVAGVVFGLLGVNGALKAGDTRRALMYPVWANMALVFGFWAYVLIRLR